MSSEMHTYWLYLKWSYPAHNRLIVHRFCLVALGYGLTSAQHRRVAVACRPVAVSCCGWSFVGCGQVAVVGHIMVSVGCGQVAVSCGWSFVGCGQVAVVGHVMVSVGCGLVVVGNDNVRLNKMGHFEVSQLHRIIIFRFSTTQNYWFYILLRFIFRFLN